MSFLLRAFLPFFIFCSIVLLAYPKTVQAFSGTFNLSGPLFSGDVFSFTGDTFSPDLKKGGPPYICYLYVDTQIDAQNNECDPKSLDFFYSPITGAYPYHVVVQDIISDTWTSNDVSYITPTSTPLPSEPPLSVDIASSSAFLLGLRDNMIIKLAFIMIVFLLTFLLIYKIAKKA